MEENREQKIRLWFDMWLQAKDLGIKNLFAPRLYLYRELGPQV